MNNLVGLLVVGSIYAIIWFFNLAKQQAEQKKAAEATRLQALTLARQQQQAQQQPAQRSPQISEAELFPVQSKAKKKFKNVRLQRENNVMTTDVTTREALRSGLTPIAQTLDRIDSGLSPSASAIEQQSGVDDEHDISLKILTMLSTPQSMQQAVVLSEILNRKDY